MQILRMMVPPVDLPATLCRLAPNLKRLKLEVQANPLTASLLARPVSDFWVVRLEGPITPGDEENVRLLHFPEYLRHLVLGFYPCYLPIGWEGPRIKTLTDSMIQHMENGAAAFDNVLPLPFEEDDEDDDDNSYDMDFQPLTCLPMQKHLSMDLFGAEEDQRFREFVKNWERCTAGREVAWTRTSKAL